MNALRFLTYVLILAGLTACGQDADAPEAVEQGPTEEQYQLNAMLMGEPPSERTFVDIEVDRTVTISATENVTLFNPVVIWYLKDGNIYVWDGGDFRIKAFTPEGQHVGTFGDGRGQGPGQFQVAMTLEIQQDSLFLFDPTSRRFSYFHKDGTLGRTEKIETSVTDYAQSMDNTVYLMFDGPEVNPYVSVMPQGGRSHRFEDLMSRDVPNIVFDGRLHAASSQGIHIPYYYPVLLAFAPDDSLARAYPTPDYGTAPLPEPRTSGEGFSRSVRPPLSETRLHWGSEVNDEVLAVQIRSREQGVFLFDIYDAWSLTYQHTARIPAGLLSKAQLAYEDGLLVTHSDTTVAVHHLTMD